MQQDHRAIKRRCAPRSTDLGVPHEYHQAGDVNVSAGESMKAIFLTGIALLICIPAPKAQTRPAAWVEGRNYVLLSPVQHTQVSPGKVEVLEVFSYGCPACNSFQ